MRQSFQAHTYYRIFTGNYNTLSLLKTLSLSARCCTVPGLGQSQTWAQAGRRTPWEQPCRGHGCSWQNVWRHLSINREEHTRWNSVCSHLRTRKIRSAFSITYREGITDRKERGMGNCRGGSSQMCQYPLTILELKGEKWENQGQSPSLRC